jgi:hypothetical protein
MNKNKIDPSDLVFSEKTETFSEWTNNNDQTAVFRLLTHEKRPGNHRQFGPDCQASLFLPVTVEPGQTIKLPSVYDQSIRKVNEKTGQVVGGLCPWLVKTGEEDIIVHRSLDYKAAFLQEEAKELVEGMKKENELREALATLEKHKAQIAAASVSIEEKKAGRPAKKV